jgi:hypothetical protein
MKDRTTTTHHDPGWSDTMALGTVNVEQLRDHHDDDEVSFSPQLSVPREHAMPKFPLLEIFLSSSEIDEYKLQDSALPPGILPWNLSAILTLLALLVIVPGFLGLEVKSCTMNNAMNLVMGIFFLTVAVNMTSETHVVKEEFYAKPEECESMPLDDSTSNLRLCYIVEEDRRRGDDDEEERNVTITRGGGGHCVKGYESHVLDRGNDLPNELEPTNLFKEIIAGRIESEPTEFFIDTMFIAMVLNSQNAYEVILSDELMGDRNGLDGSDDSSSTDENESKRGSEASDDGITELSVPGLHTDDENVSTISSSSSEYSLETQDEAYQKFTAQRQSHLRKRPISDAHSVSFEVSMMTGHEGNDEICNDVCILGNTHDLDNMQNVDVDELNKIWNARSPGIEYGPDEASV